MKKITALILFVCLILSLSACSGGNQGSSDIPKNENGVSSLSFKEAASFESLKAIDGQTVEISGYMATSSPADGSFIFLMNLPYQSCPFCKPNTSQLSNTMEVYPKDGQTFDYTTQAIKVTGTLAVAKSEKESFTDPYGYEFNFKIVDAEYRILQADELGENMKLWQALAESDVINEIYNMYDFVNFTVAWDTYFVNESEDEEGNRIPGYYLYASDAEHFLYNDGAQYNYGTQDGYFEGLIAKIEAVDKTAFSDLTENIKEAQALAGKGLAALKNGEYTSEKQYVEKFDNEDYVYKLNDSEALTAEMDELYNFFANWLGEWEM